MVFVSTVVFLFVNAALYRGPTYVSVSRRRARTAFSLMNTPPTHSKCNNTRGDVGTYFRLFTFKCFVYKLVLV